MARFDAVMPGDAIVALQPDSEEGYQQPADVILALGARIRV